MIALFVVILVGFSFSTSAQIFTPPYTTPELIGGYQAIVDYIVVHELYPDSALSAGINGDALVQFMVNAKGRPVDVEMAQERPENMGFGETAVEVMENMLFKPGLDSDGNPVVIKMQQVIRFRVDKYKNALSQKSQR